MKFGGAIATNVRVVGTHWVVGEIPSNIGGAGLTSVTLTYALTTLTLPDYFKYLPDISAVQV